MKKLLPLLFLLTALTSFAQTEKGQVSGKVEDAAAKAIAAATVSLLKATDSAMLKISVADKDGSYRFENVPDGRYLLSVTAVGYQAGYSKSFEVSPTAANVSVVTVQLQPATTALAGVTVTAKRPLIE